MMTRERAIEILEAFGANPERWPADERHAVEAAIAEDAGLQALADRERELDSRLMDWNALPPRAAAMEALFAAAEQTVQSNKVWSAPARRWNSWLAGGGAVALAAGIVAALMLAGQPATQAPVNTPAEVTDTAAITLVFSAEQSEGWL